MRTADSVQNELFMYIVVFLAVSMQKNIMSHMTQGSSHSVAVNRESRIYTYYIAWRKFVCWCRMCYLNPDAEIYYHLP